jgi:PPOX class probable F420-dependent enzyme
MAPAERDAFLRETRIASLVTLNEDGSPNSVPVWFEWDGEVARVFTGRGSAKVRRIERDPRVALSMYEGVGAQEAWVSIDGSAAVEPGDAMPLVRRLAERYYEPERAQATLQEWEAHAETFVVLRVKPSRLRSYVAR